jgi:hypothetical protein
VNESSALRPKIFGTGLLALDLVMSADRSEPAHAWAGGTCGNVLAILALLGWDAFPVARLNKDAASQRVRADLKKWGVQLKFASCGPTTDTPIIIQHILRAGDGAPRHRFSWSCPHCGSWLPSFKPVTTKAVGPVTEHFTGIKAFFMGADGIKGPSYISAAGKDIAEGVFASVGEVPQAKLPAAGLKFQDDFKAKYNIKAEDLESYAKYGYAAAQVVLNAFTKVCGKDRDAIRAAIVGTKDLPTVVGNMTFDANGDTTDTSMTGFIVKNGAWVEADVKLAN